eukprot:scaffold5371_cov190-Skeletonema_marinoi.AAC.3
MGLLSKGDIRNLPVWEEGGLRRQRKILTETTSTATGGKKRVDNNKQGEDKADDSKEASEGGNLLCSFKTCQSKAADGGICDGQHSYHDVFFKVNDDTTTDGGKA